MGDRRRWRTASGVCLCLGIATFVHAARAQDITVGNGADANGGTAAGAATNPAAGNGTGNAGTTPGATGPLIASPSVLPATGVGYAGPDVRLGNLGGRFATPLTGQPLQPATRSWTLTPSISLTEEYSSGGRGMGSVGTGSLGSQFITIVQPSILASGDTTRFHGELSYAPQILIYVPDGNQNRVAQNFNARLLATLVPETLFLDVRGSGAVQAIAAAQAPNETTTLNRGNTAQTYSFSASPYAVHRFGDWGTGEVGGSYGLSAQNALEPGTPQSLRGALASASNQNVTIESGHVAFVTGEAFFRYNGTALAQATSFNGTGVLSGAYRDIVTLDSGYALTRTITALATVGWENIHYAGTAPVIIDDGVWNVGMRWVPNEGSTITVRYGHKDGLNALLVDAGYQVTARTTIYARMSTGLTTSAEELQNALATSDLDALGNPVDHTTGAPLISAANFFGTQNNLYKTTLASLTGVLMLDRDNLSAGITSQVQTLVSASNAVGKAGGNSRGIYGTFTWSHQLRPNLQSRFYAQYGTQQNTGVLSATQQLVVTSLSLSYALSPTLSAQVQYSFTDTWGGNLTAAQAAGIGTGINGPQSVFLASLIKSF